MKVYEYDEVCLWIGKVVLFAEDAHEGQVRKYTGEPYITHPMAVAAIVQTADYCDGDMIAAAYLHDVIEDTEKTYEDILYEFGIETADMVRGLTKVTSKADGSRATRQAKEAEHLESQCSRTKTVKVADIIHNISTIQYLDPEFAKVYIPEKKNLLDTALIDADQTLWIRAMKIIQGWEENNES